MKQNKRISPEKEQKFGKKVDYNDYIVLKNSFIEIGDKYKKLKQDHQNTIKLLKEYQIQISEFQQTKNNITQMLKLIQEKFQKQIENNNNQNKEEEKENNNKDINKNENDANFAQKISELENEIKSKNEENSKNKDKNQELLDKIKILEEEIIKNKEEIEKREQIIENMNIMQKGYDENMKEKDNEVDILSKELNELKEKNKNENEELLNKIILKEEEIKNKDNIILEVNKKNEELKEKIQKLEENIKNLKEKREEKIEIENKEYNKKINWNDIISINNKINLDYIGIKKDIKNDEIKNKNYLLKKEKNAFITLSRISETNLSTNKNDNVKNINNTNNKNINEIIMNNYLNTINVGFNGLNSINNNIELDSEDASINIPTNLESEPIPSFILCLKKTNNNS